MIEQQNGMTFEERSRALQAELGILEQKYFLRLYAANVRLQNDEVVPLIRVADNFRVAVPTTQQKDADQTKKGNPARK